ncbi:MAG TPA: class I SAM-dependent methyltransferase [Acidimicrobiales bacterium]|nr:class I SAM-dependent methyltransferase [Acidimicrobiales bacterium]
MEFHNRDKAAEHHKLMVSLVAEMRAKYTWEDVACAVCGEPGPTTPAFEKWDLAMVTCDRCGHLFVTPRLPESAVPELYGSRYWEDYSKAIGSPTLRERADWDYRNSFYKLQRDVLPFRTTGRLVDVGASNGGMVRAAAESGFEAVGIEPSPEICALAREVNGVTMICGDIRHLKLAAASFDVVTMHDVLEHVFDPVGTLRACRRVLKPGGLLVVEMPSGDSLCALELGTEWSYFSPLEHVNLFTQANAARIVRAAGFGIVDHYDPHEENQIIIGEAVAA